jgi:hypothetical protein
LNAHEREEKLLLQSTKKKSNPILSFHKGALVSLLPLLLLLLLAESRGKVKQEETVPLSSLYMSFELDTCSLRDVIVIVCVRKTFAMHGINEASARSSRHVGRGERERARGKTRASLLEQIRLLLGEERENEKRSIEREQITTV